MKNVKASIPEQHHFKNSVKRFFYERFVQQLVACITVIAPRTVLDVGCGKGVVTYAARQQLPQLTITGVDINRTGLVTAQQLNPGYDVVAGDIHLLPFPDNLFDLIVCTEVLEHLECPHLAITELQRVGKHALLLSVPHEPYFRLGNLFSGHYLSSWGNYPEHRQLWTKAQFICEVSRFLTVRQVWTPFPWVIIWAQKH
jgi:2-polyprenyl-3-methyl-5-hydroxy-6-metoxy-1,4-benzoquinol methylase